MDIDSISMATGNSHNSRQLSIFILSIKVYKTKSRVMANVAKYKPSHMYKKTRMQNVLLQICRSESISFSYFL